MLINKQEMAEKAGLKVFDCALPQTWLNNISAGNEAIYNMLCCYCVWCYDEYKVFGAAVGLNEETKNFLASQFFNKDSVEKPSPEHSIYINL